MGEFHDAVSTLLQAFTSGISIIKTQRGRRKYDKTTIDPERKEAESSLSRSLKRNRREVKTAYEKEAETYGPGFHAGDAEARSRLATILLRLNAGFVSIIERFTRGKSSPADYQTLINLSNTSRLEAMRTFEQLSQRISQSSLALVPTTGTNQTQRRRKKSSKKGTSSARSKSTSELASTPFGFANTEGWVRPKHGRKSSSESIKPAGGSGPKKASSTSTKSTSPSPNEIKKLPAAIPAAVPQVKAKSSQSDPTTPPADAKRNIVSERQHGTVSRKSIMSFASDSTKIGEIPEHRWARTDGNGEHAEVKYPITTFYPLEPYQEPEKRSRLRKLFGRS